MDPGQLAEGIWEALITTAFGLLVAIPTFVAYNYLVSKVEEIVGDIKKASRYSPSVMPIDGIRRVIDRMIPDLTFQEALERTGRHLNI